jgi:hypothetical protein
MKKMKTYQIIIELDNGIVMDSTNKKDKVDVAVETFNQMAVPNSHLKVYRLDESGMGYSLVHAKKIEGAPTPAPERRLIGFGRW